MGQGSDGWTASDSADLYRIDSWSGGYFGVSLAGTVEVYPSGDDTRSIDVHEVIVGLTDRGITAPVLIRFPGILEHRMNELRKTFDTAIAEAGYTGGYSCAYPIKVNQERHVCELIRDVGARLGFGLEVGSKPELFAGLALTQGFNTMPLVCNGFKDAEYIETVVLAAKMGRNVLPVVERVHELQLIHRSARTHDVLPTFGIRAKLAATGVGRWAESSGVRGKFGLTVGEILHAVDYLRSENLLPGLKMLHCHIGSQICDIRAIKYMVNELAHLYVEMVRAGAPIETLNIGGGLGVDYDGSHSDTPSSLNYTVDQYASDVVQRIIAICDEAGVAHPHLMTESGRALVAHSSLLVCEVIGIRIFPSEPDLSLVQQAMAGEDIPQPLLDVHSAYERLGGPDILEVYADAEHAFSEAMNLFNLGYMDLRGRAACEELFWAIGTSALRHFGDDIPDGLAHLPDQLADLYFVNVSVFQSLLDSWGIEQLFPIMPIHRLEEEPTRRGVLADITCDSDGRVDHFPGDAGPKTTLELHAASEGSHYGQCDGASPYYLGIFLTGAYQETLGALHNLFGDTHAVHVTVDENDSWRIDTTVEGESVRDVLSYVQFNPEEMRLRLRGDIEAAVEAARLTLSEAASMQRFLDESLQGYTYLE